MSSGGLTLRLIFIVALLVAVGLYTYDYDLVPGEVAVFVALAGIYPLTYLAYLGFAAKTHRKRLEDDFRLLGLAREEELVATVESLYDTVYSPIQFVVYIGLIILISLVVFWGYLRCGANAVNCVPGVEPAIVKLICCAYLGSYVFSVQELVRRYNTFDLQPQVYSSAVVRMLIALAIVFAGASIILGPTTPAGDPVWPAAVAFTIGIFPTQGLVWLTQLGNRLIESAPVQRSVLPLASLLGISPWHEARLAQMGIDDAQNLATVDIRRLLLTTQFDTQEIASWIDQAILGVKVGDKLPRFREAKIGSFHELRVMLAQLSLEAPAPLSAPEQEARTKGRERLAVALALAHVDELNRLADDSNFPNYSHIAEYYARSSRVVHRRASVGMDAVLGPIFRELAIDKPLGAADGDDRAELNRYLADIQRLLGQRRNDARLWNTLGVAYYRLGRPLDALYAYERAIEMDRNLAEPHHHRSLVQIDQGQYAEAIRSCTNAIQLDRVHADAFNNRGLAYMRSGYFDLALADFDEALRLDPRLPSAYLNRGVTYNAVARFGEARRDFEHAWLLDDSAPDLWLPWGLALIGVVDYPSALEKLSRAVISDAQAATPRARRGYVYYLLENFAPARLDVEEALRIDPTSLFARNSLGLLETRLGHHEVAIEHYRKVLETAPEQYVTRYNLALALARAGQNADACAELRQVVEDSPQDGFEAQDAKRRLDVDCGVE